MPVKSLPNWKILLIIGAVALANLFIVTKVTGLTYSEEGMWDYEPMTMEEETTS